MFTLLLRMKFSWDHKLNAYLCTTGTPTQIAMPHFHYLQHSTKSSTRCPWNYDQLLVDWGGRKCRPSYVVVLVKLLVQCKKKYCFSLFKQGISFFANILFYIAYLLSLKKGPLFSEEQRFVNYQDALLWCKKELHVPHLLSSTEALIQYQCLNCKN